MPFASVAVTRECFERVALACESEGRTAAGGPAPVLSVAQTVCCGRDSAEVRRRAEAIGYPDDVLRKIPLVGSPAEIVDKIGQFAQAGTSRIHLQVLDLNDLDHLDLIAGDVGAATALGQRCAAALRLPGVGPLACGRLGTPCEGCSASGDPSGCSAWALPW